MVSWLQLNQLWFALMFDTKYLSNFYHDIFFCWIFKKKKKNTVEREAMFNINLDAYGYQLAYT